MVGPVFKRLPARLVYLNLRKVDDKNDDDNNDEDTDQGENKEENDADDACGC
jgi:hypothetical protein